MTTTDKTMLAELQPIEKQTLRELRKLSGLAVREIAEWKAFAATVNKEIARREKVNAAKASK